MNSLSLKAGYIIKVSDTNHPETTGVIIESKPDNLICFNTDMDKRPMFYKVNLQNSNFNLDNNKTINHSDYSDLKKALLQYFHIHKNNQDEIKMLNNVISFAFPNGVPKIEDKSTHIDEYQLESDDKHFLELGTQIRIKCHPKSSISFLDNQVLDIKDVFPKGIRVLRRGATSDSNKFYTLFYRQPPTDNTLAGVKEIEILPKNKSVSQTISIKEQLEKASDKTKGYQTQIIDKDGHIYILDSNTLEFNSEDKKTKGVYYPGSDELNIIKNKLLGVGMIDSDDDSDFESGPVEKILIPSDDEDDFFSETYKISRPCSPATTDITMPVIKKNNYHLDLNLEEIPLENQAENQEESDSDEESNTKMFIIGGAKKNSDSDKKLKKEMSKTKTEDLEFDFDFDFEQDEIEGLKSKMSKLEKDDDYEETKTRTGEGSDSEFDNDTDNELEIIDEPIDFEISKVVYRSKKVLVPDEKKVFQPQIQKNEFFKYLLEKYIPNKQLRKNNFLINQVHKINNRIVDLKDELIGLKSQYDDINNMNDTDNIKDTDNTDDTDNIKDIDDMDDMDNMNDKIIYNKGKKPLLDSYLKNDYRNKFLIPVVLDRKKLYFQNQVSDYHYEFYSQNSNILNKNYQQVINELNEMIEQKGSSKISSITYFQLEKAINDLMKPYKINDDSKIIGFIGNNVDKVPDN